MKQPARLGYIDNELVAAVRPATKERAGRVRAALGYLSGRDVVVSPGSGWMSVRVDRDVLGGVPEKVLSEVGELVNMGVVKPDVARLYLGGPAVEALTDGRLPDTQYGDPDLAAVDGVETVLESI